VRVLEVPLAHDVQAYDFKRVGGGLLVQTPTRERHAGELRVVTKRKPTDKELADLMFAWRVAKIREVERDRLLRRRTGHSRRCRAR